MAIVAAISPSPNKLYPAYWPLIYRGQASGTPPVVYCDVYFNGTFYKTLSSNTPEYVVGGDAVFRFDIQGVAQEFIATWLPNQQDATQETSYSALATVYYGAAICFCKLRSSTADIYGIITPDGPVPVQGTVDSPPIAGGGFPTTSIMIVNAAANWNIDVSDLATSLKGYIGPAAAIGVIPVTAKVYPLSHMVKSKVYASDFAMLPIVVDKSGCEGLSACNAQAGIVMFNRAGASVFVGLAPLFTLTDQSIFYIPSGLGNWQVILPAVTAALPTTYSYQVYVENMDTHHILYASPVYYLQPKPAAHARIWFRNYLGHFDQVNFNVKEESLKVSSAVTEKLQTNPPVSTLRSSFGINRNKVRSAEEVTVSDSFDELDMPVLKELMSTTLAFLEVANPDAALGSAATVLLPITIIDGDYTTQRWDDRYEYVVAIKFKYANENQIVR